MCTTITICTTATNHLDHMCFISWERAQKLGHIRIGCELGKIIPFNSLAQRPPGQVHPSLYQIQHIFNLLTQVQCAAQRPRDIMFWSSSPKFNPSLTRSPTSSGHYVLAKFTGFPAPMSLLCLEITAFQVYLPKRDIFANNTFQQLVCSCQRISLSEDPMHMVVLSHIIEGAPETQCLYSRRCPA